MQKPVVGISIGDMNGIGPEVILKTFADERMFDLCTPVVYGSIKAMVYHSKTIGSKHYPMSQTTSLGNVSSTKLNVLQCWDEVVAINLGTADSTSGKYARLSFEKAVFDLKNGNIDILVTAPINKKAIKDAGFKYAGHTEYLDQELTGEALMLLVHDDLRVGLVTGHVPIKDVAAKITKEAIIKKVKIIHEAMAKDFGKPQPLIAVLGLNPHAGDDGAIGHEDVNIIRPAIEACKQEGMFAMGPFSADGFFGSGEYKKYDAILAMYHDQGLIPFKTLAFGSGVNYTAGLSGIRTSPDHGTAMAIAGSNVANPASFRQAIFLGIDIWRNRKEYMIATANPIHKQQKRKKDFGVDEALTPEDNEEALY